ncbi:class I SAM-dependent methyltransferase [Streptomyces sp. NPDC058620]|uniref:class I SAM-dependent methyltransferase n=1 Tax=Streptomyces sp. NPDC058620 TaxID=3346560 RepID=UPI0036542356
MSASATEIQARTLAGYARASALRQVLDRDWVLDRVTGAPEVIVDLGSGIGQLLEEALGRYPSIRLAIGLERSEHRIAEAAERLRPHRDRVSLRETDLTTPPELHEPADVVTMTSVLHWLHPGERPFLEWVERQLAPEGVFYLTTYHPKRDADGFGGEDEIVRDALAALGTAHADAPAVFAAHDVLPIGTRTRPVAELDSLFAEFFRPSEHVERQAVVTVESAEQYEHFHAATFGDYYSRLVAPERRAEFFGAVGASAWRRQTERGHVSSMPVRLWELSPNRRDAR